MSAGGDRSSTRPHTTAVVLAGGTGTRIGATVPKQLLELRGRPLLAYALETFDRSPVVDDILVVMAADHVDAVRHWVRDAALRKVTGVVPGGSTRSASARRALAAIANAAGDVLIHDAARPFVTAEIIAACSSALRSYDAVGTAVPSADTVVEAVDGVVTVIPSRDRMWRMQTPQAFHLRTIRAAHDLAAQDAEFEPTDDCGVVLRYLPDVPVALVRGDEENIKVTTPLDLQIADLIARRRARSSS